MSLAKSADGVFNSTTNTMTHDNLPDTTHDDPAPGSSTPYIYIFADTFDDNKAEQTIDTLCQRGITTVESILSMTIPLIVTSTVTHSYDEEKESATGITINGIPWCAFVDFSVQERRILIPAVLEALHNKITESFHIHPMSYLNDRHVFSIDGDPSLEQHIMHLAQQRLSNTKNNTEN